MLWNDFYRSTGFYTNTYTYIYLQNPPPTFTHKHTCILYRSINPAHWLKRKKKNEKKKTTLLKAPRWFNVIMNMGNNFTIQIMWILWTAI